MKKKLEKNRFGSNGETGLTLIELIIAFAILAAVAVTFIGSLSSNTRSVAIADDRATAENLARSQIEWVKNADYSYNATSYTLAPILDSSDYELYTANITAEALNDPDDGIQKITVVIRREDRTVYTLQSYKVDR